MSGFRPYFWHELVAAAYDGNWRWHWILPERAVHDGWRDVDADGHSDYVDGADGADDVVDAVDDVVDDSVDDDDVGIMAVATKNAAATGKKTNNNNDLNPHELNPLWEVVPEQFINKIKACCWKYVLNTK